MNWKDIEGYGGWYKISNYGHVKSWKNNNHGTRAKEPKILSPIQHNVGYKYYSLRKDGKTIRHLRHRLVAKHFVYNPKGLPHVNHKDGDKSNDYYKNLEWCTHAENMKHGFDTGLINNRGENNGNTNLTRSEVIEIKLLLKKGELKGTEIAKRFGVHPNTIYGINNGKRWSHVKI